MKAVVIVANGWNAGWLGCYGNEWVPTPHIDQLAAEGFVFDQHFVSEVGAPLAPADHLASLRSYGVRTVRVHDLTDNRASNSSGWDESERVAPSDDVSPGKSLFAAAKKKLRDLAAADSWLLWIETDRLVPPWSVSLDFFDRLADDLTSDEEGQTPPPWDEPPQGATKLSDRDLERLQATFAAVVAEWDTEVGDFLARWRKLGLDQSTLLVITSGCGLALGEHDWIGGGERPFEEVVHVPLIARLPNAEPSGRRIAVLTSSIDVMQGLFELLGITSTGTSLFNLGRGESSGKRSYLLQELHFTDGSEWALRTPEWACLVSDKRQPLLFRKPEDRWEVNNVRLQHLEWAEYLEALVRNLVTRRATVETDSPPLKEYHEVVAQAGPDGGKR
jgi:arylsulfatase A-like enzyme